MSVAARTKVVHIGKMEDDTRLVQFKLMLPADLKARVEDAAKASRRSLSQEIVSVLIDRFPAPKLPDIDDVSAMLEYTAAGESDEKMRERAEQLNRELKEADAKIRLKVFDETNAKIFGAKVGIVHVIKISRNTLDDLKHPDD